MPRRLRTKLNHVKGEPRNPKSKEDSKRNRFSSPKKNARVPPSTSLHQDPPLIPYFRPPSPTCIISPTANHAHWPGRPPRPCSGLPRGAKTAILAPAE